MKVYVVVHELDDMYCCVFRKRADAERWVKNHTHFIVYRILEEEV